MFQIAITNHPTFTEISRKAEMTDLLYDKQAKKITMGVRINHFIGDVALSDLDRSIKLTLDNTAQYPTGETDTEGNPVKIGDYDYFIGMAEAGTPLKTLVESGIAQVDSTGTLNAKCSYKDIVTEEI